VLSHIQGQVRTLDLNQRPFVATLPQKLGRRTATREAHEPAAVGGQPVQVNIGLVLDLDATIPENAKQRWRVIRNVVFRGGGAGAATHEAQRTKAVSE
jgi:hypothetical protein